MSFVKVTGINASSKHLERVKKQTPFMMSLAINETLKETQAHTVEEILPDAFTLRSPQRPQWWKKGTRFGFNIKFSDKRKSPIAGVLGSRAEWLKEQEFGGTRSGRGGHRLAIPSPGLWRYLGSRFSDR